MVVTSKPGGTLVNDKSPPNRAYRCHGVKPPSHVHIVHIVSAAAAPVGKTLQSELGRWFLQHPSSTYIHQVASCMGCSTLPPRVRRCRDPVSTWCWFTVVPVYFLPTAFKVHFLVTVETLGIRLAWRNNLVDFFYRGKKVTPRLDQLEAASHACGTAIKHIHQFYSLFIHITLK